MHKDKKILANLWISVFSLPFRYNSGHTIDLEGMVTCLAAAKVSLSVITYTLNVSMRRILCCSGTFPVSVDMLLMSEQGDTVTSIKTDVL